jgi:hypothetical protein
MRKNAQVRVWLLGMLISWGASVCFIAAADNPYDSIVERNVFGLKSPPPPPPPPDNKPPPPKVTLTGITTMFGNKRALLKVQMPARPQEPAHEQSFILAEGERDGDIEVVEIDDTAGTIKVNNFGTLMTVAFDKESNKAPGGAAPGAQVPPVNPFARPQVNPMNPGPGQPAVAIPAAPGAASGIKPVPIRPHLPMPPGGQAQ